MASAAGRSEQSSVRLADARGAAQAGRHAAQAEASLNPLWHSLRAYEFTLYKSKSEHFAKNFLDLTHIKVFDDSKGFSPNRVDMQKPLTILMSMAGLLVVLCAINVATLLLLRAARRAREMSMRYALGARRSRIVSQLLVEGGLLGLAGAAAGLPLAPVVARVLVRMMTSSDPGTEPYSASVDTRVLIFTMALSLLATARVQHCAGLSFPSSRSGRFASPDYRHRLQEIAALSQSCRGHPDRAQRASSGWCGAVCTHARQSPPRSRLASRPRILRYSRLIPLRPGTAKIALHRSSRPLSIRCAASPVSFPWRPPTIRNSSAIPRLPITRCRDTSRRKTST